MEKEKSLPEINAYFSLTGVIEKSMFEYIRKPALGVTDKEAESNTDIHVMFYENKAGHIVPATEVRLSTAGTEGINGLLDKNSDDMGIVENHIINLLPSDVLRVLGKSDEAFSSKLAEFNGTDSPKNNFLRHVNDSLLPKVGFQFPKKSI